MSSPDSPDISAGLFAFCLAESRLFAFCLAESRLFEFHLAESVQAFYPQDYSWLKIYTNLRRIFKASIPDISEYDARISETRAYGLPDYLQKLRPGIRIWKTIGR